MSVGFNRTGIYDVGYQRAMVNVCGTIIVNGPVSIGAGSRIEVAKNATLVFNGKVSNSAGVTIECQDQISIGDNTVISWNTTIIDCDFHYVKKN